MRHHFFLCALVLGTFAYGQKNKIQEYKPITGANIDHAFPVAARVLLLNYKVNIFEINWSEQIMRSNFILYNQILLGQLRSRFEIKIDKTNTLFVQMVDNEMYDAEGQVWKPIYPGKKERNLQTELINFIRDGLQKADDVKTAQEWFYKDLEINSRFFEHATELAGVRWFENYLKDRQVKWKATFNDIKNNNDNSYKYAELYSLKVNTLTTEQTKFNIVKFTNSDRNTMTSKNTLVDFEGYCRSLVYKEGIFNIVLTDQLETPIPSNSVQSNEANAQKSVLEYAEKLKQLKSLLDQGILTKEEYETEKKKVLGKNQ